MKDLINEELLLHYLNETATVEESEQVEKWSVLSDENQLALEQMYFTLQAGNRLKRMQSVNANKSYQMLKERIRRNKAKEKRRLVFRRLQRVAAILLLPVAALLTGLLLMQNGQIPVQYVELCSNPGLVASFILPDGSKVWLNGGSRLRYPTTFKGDTREVQMSGQGYFEIARNIRQPFTVKSGDSFSLEVLGTSFNLAAYDDEDVIITTLVEGSLRLKMMQNGRLVQREMKPNEKVFYKINRDSEAVKTDTVAPQGNPNLAKNEKNEKNEPKPESVKVTLVDPKYDIAWKNQQLLFKDHPMEEVIRTLARYYNVQFVVKNNNVMNSVITGKFSNEPLAQVMEYLEIASKIHYRIIPSTTKNDELISGIVEIWK